ncbi:isopeptide-forming domain-containing fimbrial protein [Bifidobacterium sp. ESL0784]|uniref:isopeptide-forming domain-containing fimbrial protein n=1 Tax=Bifidobacterium sp. ESL0784 TaxID=2983231 RepID=UPI0023F9AF00|nr:isopeptide-forming domain-containing fimbrial protein [Bifidobacterium sp. ESL0784]MDF7640816.1 isopeptide-forming domain-containing fimbrial protein [Bifidobacterium sp. ESL0784]
MNRKVSLRAFVGAAVSAATLLALAPLGVANAAETNIDMGTQVDNTKSTITINGTDHSITGHKFAAVQIGTYDNATADLSTNKLTSVSVGTVAGVKNDAVTALSDTKTQLSLPTAEAAGFAGNPVGEVANKWLGYGSSGDDTSSNTEAKAWNGNLRKFVTNLTNTSGWNAKFTGSSLTVGPVASTNPATTEATITVGTPGVYLVEDITSDFSASTTAQKNSIPMLVSTGITTKADPSTSTPSYVLNTLGTTELGKINMKADESKITKTLDTSAGVTNDPSIGGKLHYVLSSTVPLTTGYKHYIFNMTDATSQAGLTYTGTDDVTVTIGGSPVPATDYEIKEVKYDAPFTSSTKLLVFDFTKSIRSKTYRDAIVIKFAMQVNDEAKGGALLNGAVLNTSNDTNHQPDTDAAPTPNPDGTDVNCNVTPAPANCTNGSISNEVISGQDNSASSAYFRDFDLQKVAKLSGSGLAGATFQVLDSENHAIYFNKVGNGSYKKAMTQDAPAVTELSVFHMGNGDPDPATGAPSDEGQLKVDGLAEGTYTVEEVTAPSGYSTTFKPSFSVTLGHQDSTHMDVNTFTNTADTWGLVNATSTAHTVNFTDGFAKVQNVTSISQLPLTGGAGVILALLVVVALGALTATLIVVRRRLGANDNGNANVAVAA